MLYCGIPTVEAADSDIKLTDLINDALHKKGINVKVSCDLSHKEYLYDADKISLLFDKYDIVEIDVSMIWAIKVDLLKIPKGKITWYN
jgi:hypothetical protein